jgi:hypothetical protein
MSSTNVFITKKVKKMFAKSSVLFKTAPHECFLNLSSTKSTGNKDENPSTMDQKHIEKL